MKRSALLLLALGASLMFTQCASVGPPQPPSLDLPNPAGDLRASRKDNRVTLTWTVPSLTTDRQTIRTVGPTRICRSPASEMKNCGTPVGQSAASSTKNASGQSVTGSFTEPLRSVIDNSAPFAFATYAVEVLNRDGRAAGLSNQVRVSLAPTLLPPQNFVAQVTSQGVVLSWSKVTAPEPQPTGLHFVVRIFRREEGAPQQTTASETPIEGDPKVTDSNIEWDKTYEYHAETVTMIKAPNGTEAQVEGDDTPEVKVFAHDVFPPAVPSELQAVFSGPGQPPFIDLVWAPVTDADLAGYNVYRREEGAEPVKLNPDPLKTPAYRDTQVAPGKKYFYAVTSIDIRGNESAKSEEASETVHSNASLQALTN